MKLNPIIKWAGGKSKLAPQIMSYFPSKINNYIEPFFGGGAIGLNMEAYVDGEIILSDSNASLMGLYYSMRFYPKHIIKRLSEYEKNHSEAFYYEVRKQFNLMKPSTHFIFGTEDMITHAADFIYLNKTGFNGLYRVNANGQFNVPWGKRDICPKLVDPANFIHVAHTLGNTLTYISNASRIIDDHVGQGDLVYCDPPYDGNFSNYTPQGFTQEDQIALQKSCMAASLLGATCIISNSDTPFIRDLYKDFKIVELSSARNISCKTSTRKKTQELLIIMEPSK